MTNNNDKIVTFKGSPVREPFYEGSDSFKMYGFDVDDSYDVKHSKYKNVTVTGKLPSLVINTEYEVKAYEKYNSKYGYSYEVIQIRGTEPKTEEQMKKFLNEILTDQQTNTLYEVYPDIVQRVINNNLQDIDLSKLKGIGEYTFNKIKQKITENYVYADFLAEFSGLFTFNTIKKLFEKYSSPDVVRHKLNTKPYEFLTDIDRIGFKKADTIILKYQKDGTLKSNEDFASSAQRCKAFIDYMLYENLDEGNTIMKLTSLQKMCVAGVKDAAHHFVECINDDSYYRNDKIITFKWVYDREKFVAEHIIDALRASNKNGFAVDKFKTVGEIELTEEQMQALQNVSDYNVSMLIGPGGVGKTFTTEAIIKMLEDNKKSYKLFAPTGRAGKVLSEYTHRPASTIHRGLSYNPKEGWGYNGDRKLDADFVIVDEFSMVDISLFYHLVDAIDFDKTKLLIIGDAAQLSSVSAGNCLHDMMNSGIIPTTVLTKVFRYSEGGLMTVATDCRNQKPYLKNIKDKMTQFGTNKDYVCIKSTDETILKDSLTLYKKLINEGVRPENIIFTSAYNIGQYGVNTINERLQRIVNKNYGSTECFRMKDITYYVGDIVMQTSNNYNAISYNLKYDREESSRESIYNGEIGKVVKILRYAVIIKFDAGTVIYNNKDLQNVQLGYACTTHKSQGGAADYVIIINPKAHTYMLTSNLIYVALTRTRKKCFQFCDPVVINNAVKKKDEETRMTLLKNMLVLYNSKTT